MNAFARGNVASAQRRLDDVGSYIATIRRMNDGSLAILADEHFAHLLRELELVSEDLKNAVELDDMTEAAE